MWRCRGKLQLAAAGGLVLGLALPAPAVADERADVSLRFSTGSPATPTGIALRVVYKHPSDPNGKPPALTKAAFDLPRGTRWDTTAVPQCTASDEQLRGSGRSACPAATQVGEGTFVAITGLGAPADPFIGDLVLFNGRNELIELVLFKGTDSTAGFDRLTVEGETLVAHPPATPGGPPDGRTNPQTIEFNLARRTEAGRSLITTPPACPSTRSWLSLGRFEFMDGGAANVPAATPCTAAAALRMRVAPRAVRAGERARLRVRVTSGTPGCAAGVAVRLGRARAVTDQSGRAVLRKKLSTVKTVRVRASKAGCGTATAPVEVRAARR